MKKLYTGLFFVIFSTSLFFTSFAGAWQQQTDGNYKYQKDDGSCAAKCWSWIDSNGDGLAECYYFNENGICLLNTQTPDGCTVNESGAWTVNGVVQTKPVTELVAQNTAEATTSTATTAATTSAANTTAASAPAATQKKTTASGISSSAYEGYTIIVNTSSKKYHVPSCKSVRDMKEKNKGYCSDVSYLVSNGYSACKNCH